MAAIILVIALLLLVKRKPVIDISPSNFPSFDASTTPTTPPTSASANSSATSTAGQAELNWPLDGAAERITKKPFGLYVSPNNSPVSPERFAGYHTGVDFETTPAEQDIDVPVYAVCAGPLILKKIATGYGGVAVQSCQINQEPITIIYDHLRLASIKIAPQALLSPGQLIGVLGKGYSAETSGERKHLHLGVHQGAAVVLLGYVPKENELSQWLNFLSLMK